MPIYEFYSPQSRKVYSFYARSLALSQKVPRCPDNPRFSMEKLMSTFSAPSKRNNPPEAPAGAGEDPRMDGMMAQLEQQFSGMDESNPDPRQLARMMRSVSDLTGEKMPKNMQEMMARMEKGEDPEKLEAEYGDSLDETEPSELPAEESGSRKKRARPVERDPKLYEMADYVD